MKKYFLIILVLALLLIAGCRGGAPEGVLTDEDHIVRDGWIPLQVQGEGLLDYVLVFYDPYLKVYIWIYEIEGGIFILPKSEVVPE